MHIIFITLQHATYIPCFEIILIFDKFSSSLEPFHCHQETQSWSEGICFCGLEESEASVLWLLGCARWSGRKPSGKAWPVGRLLTACLCLEGSSSPL